MTIARIIDVPRSLRAASAMLAAVSLLAGTRVWSAGCVPPPAGLVSWWAAESNALDSVGTNNGVLGYGASFANGEVGQAFNLNGTTQYVSVPSSASLNPTASISCEAWVYLRSYPYPSTTAPVIKKAGEGNGQQHGYSLEISAVGVNFGVFVNGNWANVNYTVPVTLNQWVHVAGVYDGTNVSLYENGVLSGMLNAPGTVTPSGNSFQLGHDPSNPNRYLDGLIDEASVYNTALSAAQVQAIYNAGSAGKCPVWLSITSQPQPVTVFQGATVSFSVSAAGNQPLSYQWLENTTNIPAAINPTATNTTLVLTNVQAGQSGNMYSALVTNPAGSTNSSNAVLTVLPTGSCLPPPSGLVSWWPGELSGIDIIGTNNGALIGGVKFANGEVGQAFNLNGTSQYVDVPDSASLNPTTNITCEAWVYLRSFPSVTSPVIKKAGEGLATQHGYSLEFGGDGVSFGVFVNGAWANNNDSIRVPLNQWAHVAGVYDGTNNYIYMNGVLETTVHAPGTITPSGNDLQIGHDPSDPARYLNGLIDEPTVYNTALSAAQIQLIYSAGSAGKCKAPLITGQPQSQVSYWGNNITLMANVAGSGTLSYQWEFNNVPINNATNATLMLDSLQFTNAGAYTVIISNMYGTATSAPAFLTVNPAGVSLALYPGVSIAGVPGYTYGIQYTTDLSNTNSWFGLTNLTLSESNVIWYDSVPAAQPQRYYRVLPGPIPIP